ncbi:hypothetical protein LTR22_012123 [Elasticomyces elasticus]|nr:hypothetical protein LTR22_012123 [Elasticomyces elasticus]KAK4933586.1 hypothetical protein LTR49_000049 [Elasticomyces elasticus]KAK5753773.1 hypothetical protein LTS12_016189 [Elasticomyces elasticus]
MAANDKAASTTSDQSTPFWNVNVPLSHHTMNCPDYLEYAFTNHKDREILSTMDTDCRRQTWPEVVQFCRENRLDLFQRVPSDLRLYREYCAKLVKQYGSVMKFVMDERLRWQDLEARGKGFDDAADYKILLNDWPYGVDERIVHIVVWTKFELVSDPATDDLTPEARKEIEAFVDERFVSRCGKENVIWFKNWSSLKSIHAVEHFHVMLFDPDKNFVKEITGGDVALAEKVGKPGQA